MKWMKSTAAVCALDQDFFFWISFCLHNLLSLKKAEFTFCQCFRKFCLLENVANLVCKKMLPLMLFIIQAGHTILDGECKNVLAWCVVWPTIWQEFVARGFKLQWINVTGHQVGTHVWISGHQVGNPFSLSWPTPKVSRDRVFVLATRNGFSFEESSSVKCNVCNCLRWSYVCFCHRHSLHIKAVNIMSRDKMMSAAQLLWDPDGIIPLHQWLSPSRDREDSERLRCLGNIVIPKCAALAMHQLEHEARFPQWQCQMCSWRGRKIIFWHFCHVVIPYSAFFWFPWEVAENTETRN